MKRLARLTATVLLGSLVLAGCGNDDSGSTSGGKATSGSSASETTSETATGSPSGSPAESESSAPLKGDIVGKGYAFDLPDGWSDTTKKAKALQASIDTAAAEDKPSNGFADNLNVGYNNVGGATLDELEATVPDQLKNLVKEGDLDVLPRTEIAGVKAIHHRAPAQLGQTKYFLEQYAAITDEGNLAIITFSFARDVPEAQRNDVISTVIDSWQWA
jgi:predicted small secreted protein